ncbi:MAG TPA: ferredoxin [Jatrophihabitantaceae bacterium]
MKELQIDWTRCQAHGLCAQLLPGAIRVDEWGYPLIGRARFADDDLVDARRAVAVCPTLALRLEPVDVHA